METKGGKKTNGHTCGLYCPCGKMSGGHLVVKIFLALAMIALVLVLSMVVVMKVTKGSKVYHKAFGVSCMQGQVAEKGEGKFVMGMGGGNMFFGKADAPAVPERVYGNVVKVEANLITIKNNAAAEQIIVSLADTVIISSSTEVGLSALAVGQNIVVFGTPDEQKNLEAKVIQVQ